MSATKFPLDGLFTAITATASMISEAIPSDELRLKQFEEGAPERRAKALQKLVKQSATYFKKNHLGLEDIDEYCTLIGQDSNFASLLTTKLKNKRK